MSTRNRRINIRLSDEEYDLLVTNLGTSSISNMSEFIRQMAIKGYVLNVDFSELKNIVSQLKRIGNSINQIAKVANSTGNVPREDVELIKDKQEEIWNLIKITLNKVSEM